MLKKSFFFIMRRILLIYIVCTSLNRSYSQENQLLYQFELGTLVSLGPNTYRTDPVNINNLTAVVHLVNRRFEHPSIRIRGAFLFNFSSIINAGFESGVNLRIGESFYDNQLLYSIPAQLKLSTTLNKNNHHFSIGFDAAGGYNFMNYHKGTIDENGGFIFNCSVFVTTIAKRNTNWYVKFGFERQTENVQLKIYAFDPGQIDEYYNSKSYTNQLLITLGISLF